MVQMSIEFSKADAEAFRAQMNRLINELGKAPKEAVRMGAVALLKALQSATKRAKKRRKVRVVKSSRVRLVGATRPFSLERYDSSGKKTYGTIFAPDLATAKQDKMAKIKYRGLAKASWGWAMQRLFAGQYGTAGIPVPKGKVYDVKESGTGNGFSVTIENELDYINSAFKTGKGPTVANAMKRAGNTMRGRIEQRLKGAMK